MFPLALTCLSLAAPDAPAAKIDREALKRFEGSWKLTAQEHGGKKSDKKEIVRVTLDVKGAKWTTRDGVEVKEEAAVEALDAKARPATIDLRITSGSDADKTVRGIWKRDGDTLTICVAEPNRERPKEFAGQEGSGHTLLVFTRSK
ncbi:MAG: TIGR03067 domain-containing protein [Gemmataceae bacterium]